MNTSLGIRFIFCFSIFSMGCALKCYTCSGSSESCSDVQECDKEDTCLFLTVKGATYRKCYPDAKCNLNGLAQMYGASGLNFKCCNTNLCNSSPATVMSKTFLGLLASLLLFCWMF